MPLLVCSPPQALWWGGLGFVLELTLRKAALWHCPHAANTIDPMVNIAPRIMNRNDFRFLNILLSQGILIVINNMTTAL